MVFTFFLNFRSKLDFSPIRILLLFRQKKIPQNFERKYIYDLLFLSKFLICRLFVQRGPICPLLFSFFCFDGLKLKRNPNSNSKPTRMQGIVTASINIRYVEVSSQNPFHMNEPPVFNRNCGNRLCVLLVHSILKCLTSSLLLKLITSITTNNVSLRR